MSNKIYMVLAMVVTVACDGRSDQTNILDLSAEKEQEKYSCAQYKNADPRKILGWVPEGAEHNKHEMNIPIYYIVDGRKKEKLVTVSAGHDSSPAKVWNNIQETVERARSESMSPETWRRVITRHGRPSYAYLPRGLGEGRYLSCGALRDPVDEILFDSMCSFVGREAGIFFHLNLYHDEWEKSRKQMIDALDAAVTCVAKKS